MTLSEKQAAFATELGRCTNVQDRFAALVARARIRPPMPEQLKINTNRIEGCLAQLWLAAEFREGRCWYRCDSDSLVTKGVAGALCELYNGASPEEIVSQKTDVLRELGITQHLTPNRRNGLAQVHRRIRDFAEQHIRLRT